MGTFQPSDLLFAAGEDAWAKAREREQGLNIVSVFRENRFEPVTCFGGLVLAEVRA